MLEPTLLPYIFALCVLGSLFCVLLFMLILFIRNNNKLWQRVQEHDIEKQQLQNQIWELTIKK